ncbi:Eco47II family restriction endonuclease [Lonepinella sp. MS14435]|uniref:Eco47II family restriction endonuclease n=1 Tax=Lonepinella sp. MS14435 TaxID=3003618 RepID=UPI0036DD6463
MPLLNFISDEDLYHHVEQTVQKYRFKIDLKTLNKNLIDPIKLTFDSGIYQRAFDNSALETILASEVWRQMDKSNTNHIGYFHQNIFQYIGKAKGWTVPQQGFDIENKKKHIFVEMKNKHNTMNSSSAAKTYMRMQNKLLQDEQATCYLVEIIAKHSQNIEWVCSVDKQSLKHSRIRRISIDQFYALVTSNKNAFAQLCQILPQVIKNVVAKQEQQLIENTVIDDLKRQEVNSILESLYLLAFRHYQGFKDFKLNV